MPGGAEDEDTLEELVGEKAPQGKPVLHIEGCLVEAVHDEDESFAVGREVFLGGESEKVLEGVFRPDGFLPEVGETLQDARYKVRHDHVGPVPVAHAAPDEVVGNCLPFLFQPGEEPIQDGALPDAGPAGDENPSVSLRELGRVTEEEAVQFFESRGYERQEQSDLFSVWREVSQEFLGENMFMMVKKLREKRIMRPL